MNTKNVPPDPEILKQLILTSKEPLIFKNIIKWNLLKWDLDKWADVNGNEELPFRCGINNYTLEPQWERKTNLTNMTMREFLNYKDNDKWFYFDYKYLKDWLLTIEELKDISWSSFGFPEITFKESTIWIGSNGAHTPCHVDTYGCNLVAQIYGCKRWLLFPPEENLLPTRIPYEESSIYSKLNFFSPNFETFKGVGNCRRILLKPGDVLFVPNNWWHYVENLETAISINTWLPLPVDNEKRLEEAIVQMFMSQLLKEVPSGEIEGIINPNEENKHLNKIKFEDLIETLQLCINSCKIDNSTFKKLKTNENKVLSSNNVVLTQEILNEFCNFVNFIPKLNSEEFKEWLLKQFNRFNINNNSNDDINTNKSLINVINAITHPDVIALIKTKLLK